MLLQLELRHLRLPVFVTLYPDKITIVVAHHLRDLARAGAGEEDLAAGARRSNHHHVICLALVLRADHFIDVQCHWAL